MFISKHIKGLRGFLLGAFLILAGVFLIPQAMAENCGPLHTYWTIGPNATTDYIDLCYINLGTSDIDDDFDYVAFADPTNDPNQDGISGLGVKSGSNILWGGATNCTNYVRVTTKNCDISITGDCVWAGIRTAAKVGQDVGSFSVTPIAHIRYPSGAEADVPMLINGGPGGYSYSGCAAPPPTNGVCGLDDGQTLSAFPINLCNAGSPSIVSGTGPWTWTCNGLFGGTTANCSANITPPPVNGTCGSSNGQTLSTAPTTNLCSTGTASAVLGTGPWSWSCNGANGGTNSNCSANIVATPTCSIVANPTSINQGLASNLTWTSTGATSATLNQGIGNVAINGNNSVSPNVTTTYTLAVTGPGGSANCSATITVIPPTPLYDLAIRVHVDDTTVAPNLHTNPSNPIYTDLTYDLTYQNLGNATMTNVVVTEDYDETRVQILTAPGASNNGSVLTWNIASLNAGESGVFTYEARLLDSVVSGQSVTDSAHIESTTAGMQLANETNQTNNDDSVIVNVSEINRSSQRKRVTNLNTGITSTAVHAVEGDVLEYVLSYIAGSSDLTGITIVDNDPNFESIFMYADLVDAGLGIFLDANGNGRYETASFGPFDIPAYQTQQVRFRVQIKNNLTGLGGDYTLRNSYGNDVTVVTLPNLSFNKFVSVDGAPETQNDSAVPGSNLMYRLRVTNTGGSDYNAFVFEDNITDILEYSTVTNANGGTVSTNANGQQLIAWVPTVIPAGGTVDRTFSVRVHNPLIAGGDYTLRNVYGNAVTVVTIPDVIISKSVSNANNGQSGLSVSANSGHILTYTLTARENGGTANYPNFQVVDDVTDILEYADISNISHGGVLAAGTITWPVATIAAGGSINRNFVATIRPESAWSNGLGYDRILTNIYGNVVTVNLPGVVYQPDLHIEKTVLAENASTPPAGAAGTDVHYTIIYRNEGNLNATATRIIDNYDEVNLTNIRNIIVPAGVTLVNDGNQITFTIGGLAIGSGGTITYDATISSTAPHGQDIVNTADILSAEVDNDMSDNQASALVRVASLQVDITKTSNVNNVNDSQVVIYTITVTNRELTPQTVTVRDSMSANGGRIVGHNGGSITYNPGTQQVTFQGNIGIAVGDIGNPTGVSLQGIQPNRTATIVYNSLSSNVGIPITSSSNAVNTATLVYQGQDLYTAQRVVTINNPSSGCVVNCGGGGGGGGGGNFPKQKVSLDIKKLVSLDGGSFIDADTATNALILHNKANNLVMYKVVVTNTNPVSLLNLQIQDTYVAQNSKITQHAIRNVRGATYQNGIFLIDKIEANSQASFVYQATLNTSAALANSSAYNEVKVMEYEAKGNNLDKPQFGQKDSAYVIVVVDDVFLRKYSNKSSINDGDEVIYTIIVKNIYDYDLRNVVITDNYDEAYLEILSAPGVNNGSTLEFRRTIIRPGQSVVLSYTAKGINKTGQSVQVNNRVKIFSDSADLSNQMAEKTITINPFGAPRKLAQTGNGTFFILIISLLASGYYVRRRAYT